MRRLPPVILALSLVLFNAVAAGASSPKFNWPFTRGIRGTFSVPMIEKLTDPLSDEMSADAEQLVQLLGIGDKIKRLTALNKVAQNGTLSSQERDEMRDLKFEIVEIVEETRLQIDFVCAEIDEERAVLEEARDRFSTDRDNRVNRANILAFRTNGVLWAVCEGLSIPTYKYPNLSVPAGTVGILAGIVPSVFSAYATRSMGGDHYMREAYPNMLTKIFDFPTIPRVEFPDVVWRYFNAPPSGQTRSRRQIMLDHWKNDKNIHTFSEKADQHKLKLLTGNERYITDLDLTADKITMLAQMRAMALQMSRPLLEICMAARGKKHFVEGSSLRP